MQENRDDIKRMFVGACTRSVTLILILVAIFIQSYGQPDRQSNWQSLIQSTDIHLKDFIESKDAVPVGVIMQKAIEEAGRSYKISELTNIVNICSKYCSKSVEV